MKQNEFLTTWEKETQRLADYFMKRYFKGYEPCWYWIGDDIGDVIEINDYFFSLSDMVNFIKYDYTEKEVFKYYDYALDFDVKKFHNKNKKNKNWQKIKINIETWKKLKNVKFNN